MSEPKFSELEVVRLVLPRVYAWDADATVMQKSVHVGTEGTIVSVHNGGEAYDVEFADDEGKTIAVLTLPASALEATGKADP